MKHQRLLTPVAIGMALVGVATFSEAQLKIMHVTATIAQTIAFGGQDALGDSNIANFDLADPQGHPVGTLGAHCTIVSVPPRDTREQCLLTAIVPGGQILFGGEVPLAVPGASAEFGILGGTGRFRQAHGTVHGFVNPSGTLDFRFILQ